MSRKARLRTKLGWDLLIVVPSVIDRLIVEIRITFARRNATRKMLNRLTVRSRLMLLRIVLAGRHPLKF